MLKNETLAEKFIKKGFWLYIFSFLIAPTGYIIKLIISNDLSVSEVGIIYSIIGLLALLSNYNDLGLTESLKYFLPKFWINKLYDKFKSSIVLALIIQTITAIIIAIGLWFGADFLAQNYFHSTLAAVPLKIFSLWFVIYNIHRTLDTFFVSFQDTFYYKLIDFLRMWSIVIFVLTIFLLHKGSVLTYSLAWFGGTLVATFVGIILLLKKYKEVLKKGKIKISKTLSKQIFSYSVWVIVGSQAAILLGNIDQQMIIYFLGPKQAGYYTNYLSLFSIYSILFGPLFGFLFPVTTELIEKKETWKLSLMINIFYKYFLVFGLVWGIFFAVFGPYIAFVLFGTKFVPSGELLRYSAWFIFVNVLNAINFAILAGMGKIKERVKILSLAAALNFVLNWILINKIGILGAIFSTILCNFLILILSTKIISTIVKIKLDLKFILKNLVASLIFIVGIYFLLNLTFSSRFEILIKLMIIGLFYVMILVAVNLKEIKLLVNEIKKIKNNKQIIDS